MQLIWIVSLAVTHEHKTQKLHLAKLVSRVTVKNNENNMRLLYNQTSISIIQHYSAILVLIRSCVGQNSIDEIELGLFQRPIPI